MTSWRGFGGDSLQEKDTPKYHIFVRETVISKAETVQNRVSKRSKYLNIFRIIMVLLRADFFFRIPKLFFSPKKKVGSQKKSTLMFTIGPKCAKRGPQSVQKGVPKVFKKDPKKGSQNVQKSAPLEVPKSRRSNIDFSPTS